MFLFVCAYMCVCMSLCLFFVFPFFLLFIRFNLQGSYSYVHVPINTYIVSVSVFLQFLISLLQFFLFAAIDTW